MTELEKFCLEIGKNLVYTAITLILVAVIIWIPIFLSKAI